MRAALVLALAALAVPAEAHCYSRWYYPWPQKCGAKRMLDERARVWSVEIVAMPPEREISLPDLLDIDWGHGPDDELRGRLLLRATLQRKDDK